MPTSSSCELVNAPTQGKDFAHLIADLEVGDCLAALDSVGAKCNHRHPCMRKAKSFEIHRKGKST